ncbi:MAG: chordopoxvirus fusion protein [bacterium]|nr:chordopoxvirus fusion protein [bacterium]
MPISLIKEEERHILRVLPILLKKDEQFKDSLYTILGETFVKKDDFSELKEIVKELAEAQKRTEQSVEELAEAQKRTEKKIEELVEIQQNTQEELRDLVEEHKKTRKHLGGLSMTVGYILEDEAFKALPALLKRDFGLILKDRLKRQYIIDNEEKYIEINMLGNATKDGKEIMIIGEGKSQLSKNGVNEFIRKKLKRLEGLYDEIFPVLVTYMTSEPDVEGYVKEKGIALYYSYDF